MGNQLLLLEDVDDLGRSGDLVSVKPGYARNFLLPQKKAVTADNRTLRMQAKLKEEREKRAIEDKKESEKAALQIQGKVLSIEVKVDQEGHMYGSVSSLDIVRLWEKEGIQLEKKDVQLAQPIKAVGSFEIALKLKEGVPASFTLQVVSDQPMQNQVVDPTQQSDVQKIEE